MVGRLWRWLKMIPFLAEKEKGCYYVTIHFASVEEAMKASEECRKSWLGTEVQRGGETLRMCML